MTQSSDLKITEDKKIPWMKRSFAFTITLKGNCKSIYFAPSELYSTSGKEVWLHRTDRKIRTRCTCKIIYLLQDSISDRWLIISDESLDPILDHGKSLIFQMIFNPNFSFVYFSLHFAINTPKLISIMYLFKYILENQKLYK